MSKTKIAGSIAFFLSCAAGWAQQDAKSIFLDKCSVCHGADGAGKTVKGKKLKVADVHVTAGKESEGDMIKIVTEGKGANMDAFGKDLTAAQIKDIVDYYRSLAK